MKKNNFTKSIKGSSSIEQALKTETQPVLGINFSKPANLPDLPNPASSFTDPREANKKAFNLKQGYFKKDEISMRKQDGKGRQFGSRNYEKEYYKSGKKAGQLKAVTNKHGVRVTANEQQEFNRLVAKANKQAKKLEKSVEGMLFGMTMSGGNTYIVRHFALMDHTTSLHQFKSKEAFNRYMKELKEVTRVTKSGKTVVERQAEEMKRRLILSLDKTMPIVESNVESEGTITRKRLNEVKRIIKNMSTQEFAARYAEDFFGTLNYFYDELNMNTKDNLDELMSKLELDVKLDKRFRGVKIGNAAKEFDEAKKAKKQTKQKAKTGKTSKK